MRRLPLSGRVVRLAIIMTLAVSVSPAPSAPRAGAESPLPIRIGYQATPDWLLLVARDLGLFEKAGLAPTYLKFDAGPGMIGAAQSGSIDVASLGSVPFLIGLSQGLQWVLIGINPEGAYTEGLVARKDSGISTPADLRGKRIGFSAGSTAHHGIVVLLRQHGLRPDQVTLLPLSPAEQLAALAKKEIDAAMVWEPWMQRMVHEANGRIIATEGDSGIYTNVDGYVVRRDWLRDNRETAVRYLRALLMAYEILEKDRQVAVRALAREAEIKDAWAESIYDAAPPPKIYEWANPRYSYSLVKGSALYRRLGYLAMFLRDEGLISKSVEMGDAMDASVITEAVRTRKGGH